MSKLTDKSLQLFRQLAELKNIKRAFSELFVRNGLGSDSDRFADYPDAVQQMVDTANANVESAQAETAATKDELTATQRELTTAQKEATTTYTSLKSTVSAKGVDVSAATDSNGVISALKTSVITPLGQIGYTPEDEAVYADLTFEPGTWEGDMAYSLTCYKNNKKDYNGDTSIRFAPQISWLSSCSRMFCDCSKLETIPQLDTSKVTSMFWMFLECRALTAIPLLDTSKVTNMVDMFFNCKALTTIPQFNMSKVTNMYAMFSGAEGLITIPSIDTSNAKNMNRMFELCPSLTVIPTLDMGKVTDASFIFWRDTALTFVEIHNLGKSALEIYPFSDATAWGTGGDENRQSVVDSLLTYSYDRAANGMTTATIQLSAATKALLTDEEVAAITAKGFTLA
jgi:surface protein